MEMRHGNEEWEREMGIGTRIKTEEWKWVVQTGNKNGKLQQGIRTGNRKERMRNKNGE